MKHFSTEHVFYTGGIEFEQPSVDHDGRQSTVRLIFENHVFVSANIGLLNIYQWTFFELNLPFFWIWSFYRRKSVKITKNEKIRIHMIWPISMKSLTVGLTVILGTSTD